MTRKTTTSTPSPEGFLGLLIWAVILTLVVVGTCNAYTDPEAFERSYPYPEHGP